MAFIMANNAFQSVRSLRGAPDWNVTRPDSPFAVTLQNANKEMHFG